MPELSISIGGRNFEVACQEGEEPFLQSAAALLDVEAQALVEQVGRLPEGRMLLMAGLMLADKTATLEDQVKAAQDQIRTLEAEIEHLKSSPQAAPAHLEALNALAERLEALGAPETSGAAQD